jgi:hypothetical protein
VTIQIDSIQSVLVFILSAVAVLTVAATLHWKIFAAPLLRKMIEPLAINAQIHNRILREKFPDEYERVQRDVTTDMRLRGLT